MKKLKIISLLVVAAMITGCEKETLMAQANCETITNVLSVDGQTTLTLASGKKVTAPTRKNVGEKYCYN